LFIKEPPQRKEPDENIPICHGQLFGVLSFPPTIFTVSFGLNGWTLPSSIKFIIILKILK